MEQTSLLSQSVWLALPKPTRVQLAAVFEFPPIGNVQTMYGPTGPVVLSDGYGYDALKLITLDKMNAILGTDTDNFYTAFKNLVKNIDDIVSGDFKTIYNDPVKHKLVIDLEEEIEVGELDKVIEEVVTVQTLNPIILTEARIITEEQAIRIEEKLEQNAKRFCKFCDSKGVTHKKVCTRKEHETETT